MCLINSNDASLEFRTLSKIPLTKMASLMKGTIVIHGRKALFLEGDCECLLKKMTGHVATEKKKKKADRTIFDFSVPGREDKIDISERDVFSELEKKRFVAQMKDITLNERCKSKPYQLLSMVIT